MCARERLALPRPVLLVGAGGVGSEVAHALLGTCTGAVTVVDADTVETTNLGRQAFFAEADVGAHKAEVLARELHRRSGGSIVAAARTEDIRSGAYAPSFYRMFMCVISCVDNVDTREHINKMCVIAEVPSIETGSSGYVGQAYRIVPKVTECFACAGPEAEQALPVCTVRGAPTEWKHCVHWAMQEFVPRLKEHLAAARRAGAEAGKFLQKYSGKMCTEGLEELLAQSSPESADTPAFVHAISLRRAKQHGVAARTEGHTLDVVDKTVPSVITANSIVGAIAVLELTKLAGEAGKLTGAPAQQHTKAYYLTQGAQIRGVSAQSANPQCSVCACAPRALALTDKHTLADILAELGVETKGAAVTKDSGGLLYDEEFAQNLELSLGELQIAAGTLINVYTETEKHLVHLEVL